MFEGIQENAHFLSSFRFVVFLSVDVQVGAETPAGAFEEQLGMINVT